MASDRFAWIDSWIFRAAGIVTILTFCGLTAFPNIVVSDRFSRLWPSEEQGPPEQDDLMPDADGENDGGQNHEEQNDEEQEDDQPEQEQNDEEQEDGQEGDGASRREQSDGRIDDEGQDDGEADHLHAPAQVRLENHAATTLYAGALYLHLTDQGIGTRWNPTLQVRGSDGRVHKLLLPSQGSIDVPVDGRLHRVTVTAFDAANQTIDIQVTPR